MKLEEIIRILNLKIITSEKFLNRTITGGYASDLLSDVIANAQSGNLWITMQTHINIVAVAVLKELSAIIIVNGRNPADDTIKKAEEQGVVIMCSDLPAFKLCGKLYELGIGKDN
ncbi:MAG: DRTGG domain-containing protein [Ignavibacteriae bacterium]|nr:MAG: DRTGG domain-containing protein [Ignavibacteriota bacterium]